MSLNIPLPFESIDKGKNENSRTYYIDWDNGRICGLVNDEEAIRQSIKKALITPRFQCLIYDSRYGSEIMDTLIDNEVTREYIETEIPFLVEDALIYDERILRVYNIEISFCDAYPLQNSAIVTFDVDTIYGKIPVEEVI